MGLSLKDQLLKAGLADKKQAKKAKHDNWSKRKKNKGNKKNPSEMNQAMSQAQKQQLEQAKRSRELNRQLNQEKEQKEKQAQVRQLIEQNRLDLKKCQDPFYFKLGTKIKKLYVDDEMAKKLSRGALAIVRLDDIFEIVPAKVARQVEERDPNALILLYTPESEG